MGCGASSAGVGPNNADGEEKEGFINVSREPAPEISKLEDFESVRILGAGAFGSVTLVRHPPSDRVFALKKMSKLHILGEKQADHINNERNLLALCDSPFINGLYDSYQDTTDIYLLLELVLGGDLLGYMESQGKLPLDAAKFYAASALCAIEYLHAKNIAYRDLKPENLMIDARGYLKLVDFGFAKLVPAGQKTYTLCGSPEYMAPECILGRGHDLRCDWWSMGIFVCELLSGETPFASDDKSTTYQMAVKGEIDWDNHKMPKVGQKLVEGFLVADREARLGSDETGGAAAVKKHAFFKGFDFVAFERGQRPAPYVPPISSPTDTRHCRAEEDVKPPEVDQEAASAFSGQKLHSHFPEFKRLDAEADE